MRTERKQNGKMSKRQPAMLLVLGFVGFMAFQNCSKVGVQDTAAALDNEIAANDLGNSDTPAAEDLVDSNVPSVPEANNPGTPVPEVKDPPVVSVPSRPRPEPMPAPAPPLEEDSSCKKMSELGLVKNDTNMQTVACLKNSNDRCVLICHQPSKMHKNARTKLVKSEGALRAHLGHGDTLGACKSITQDDNVCESDEDLKLPPESYSDDSDHHDKGGSCDHSNDKEHKNNAGDDRDDDDDRHDLDDGKDLNGRRRS